MLCGLQNASTLLTYSEQDECYGDCVEHWYKSVSVKRSNTVGRELAVDVWIWLIKFSTSCRAESGECAYGGRKFYSRRTFWDRGASFLTYLKFAPYRGLPSALRCVRFDGQQRILTILMLFLETESIQLDPRTDEFRLIDELWSWSGGFLESQTRGWTLISNDMYRVTPQTRCLAAFLT